VNTWDRTCRHSIVGAAFLLAIVPHGVAQCELAKLVADDAEPRRAFGKSAAISGHVAIIGSPWVSSPPAVGSAYIFERIGGNWTQVVQLEAGDTIPYDGFGDAVALVANVAVVGAPADDVYGATSGSAYIFRFDGDEWVKEAKLIPDDGHANDFFGAALAIEGNTIVVGAPWRGAAYVFEGAADDTWLQVAKLLPSDPPYWEFGLAVAVSGHVIVVGSNNDDDLGNWSGSAYVFERSTDGVWERVAKLFGHDTGGFDSFGQSVSVSGDTILVGAPGAEGHAPSSGAAYVFEREADAVWSEVAKLIADDGEISEYFGGSAALSGGVAVIGARWDDPQGFDSGSAYIFVRRPEATWTQVAKIWADDGDEDDFFGDAVAVDESIAVIGAWKDEPNGYNSGSAYIFAVGPDGDGDGVMDACECPGDLNHDWIVDYLDVLVLLEDWGCTAGDCPGDCDGDGDTDQADLGLLLANWGTVCP